MAVSGVSSAASIRTHHVTYRTAHNIFAFINRIMTHVVRAFYGLCGWTHKGRKAVGSISHTFSIPALNRIFITAFHFNRAIIWVCPACVVITFKWSIQRACYVCSTCCRSTTSITAFDTSLRAILIRRTFMNVLFA
jgi:hypothetical protein